MPLLLTTPTNMFNNVDYALGSPSYSEKQAFLSRQMLTPILSTRHYLVRMLVGSGRQPYPRLEFWSLSHGNGLTLDLPEVCVPRVPLPWTQTAPPHSVWV